MAGVRSKTSGADHNVMRELNRSLVLDLLKQNSPISRATIAKAADLAKPTVSATLDTLIDLMQPNGLAQFEQYLSALDSDARRFFELKFNSKTLKIDQKVPVQIVAAEPPKNP